MTAALHRRLALVRKRPHRTAPPYPVTHATAAHTIPSHQLSAAAVTLITAVSLFLRIRHIDFQSLWLDEGYTLLFSSLPLSKLVTVGGAHEHPPLYYLLVHVLSGLDHSYLVPRYISVAAGTASIPLLYAVGARIFDRAVGFVAALFVAASPFHFWFSDDGRAYELACFFVLLSYLLVLLALDADTGRPGTGWLWIGYGTTLAACLYTEYTTAFVLIPQALLLVPARQRGSLRPLIASWVGAILVFLPWVPTWLNNARTVSGNYWIPSPTFDAVRDVILEALGLKGTCPRSPCTGSLSPLPGVLGHLDAIALVVALVLAAILLGALVRRNLALVLAVAWFVLPLALVAALAVRRSLFLDRVFLDATFGLYLVLAWLAVSMVRRSVTFPLAALVVIPLFGGVLGLHVVSSEVTNSDWKAASLDFLSAYRPGQAVVYYPGPLRSIVRSYLATGWHPNREVPVWFRQYLDVPGWQSRYPHATDDRLRTMQLAQAAAGTRAVWLLAEDYTGLPAARHWFTAHGFTLRLSQLYTGDTRIELWQRDPITAFGSVVVPPGFNAGWTHVGTPIARGTTVSVAGRTSLHRSFPVQPGRAYAVSIEYRCFPPAYPLVSVQTTDASGHGAAHASRFSTADDVFPRTKWYDWPVTGVWTSQPFGFLVPPGHVRATLQLRTLWGSCSWSNVAVYRER